MASLLTCLVRVALKGYLSFKRGIQKIGGILFTLLPLSVLYKTNKSAYRGLTVRTAGQTLIKIGGEGIKCIARSINEGITFNENV